MAGLSGDGGNIVKKGDADGGICCELRVSNNLLERLRLAAKQLQDVLNECGEFIEADIRQTRVSTLGKKDRLIFEVDVTFKERLF